MIDLVGPFGVAFATQYCLSLQDRHKYSLSGKLH